MSCQMIREHMRERADSEEDKIILQYVTYIMVFVAFSASFVYRITNQPGVTDTLVVFLVSLLVLLTILFSHTGTRLLKRLKLPGGFEAEWFDELKVDAAKLGAGEPSKTARDKIDEIRSTEEVAAGALLKMVTEIERALREIATNNDIRGAERAPLKKLVDLLVEERILSKDLAHIITEFRMMRNGIFHGKIEVNARNLADAITVGEIVLSELEKVPSGSPRANQTHTA